MSKQRDHTPSWKIVGQGERPTKRVGIYARVDDAQGLELSGVSQSTILATQCLFWYMKMRLGCWRFSAIQFFDCEVMFIMKDSILRTGDICIVQQKSKYHVMKVSQDRENGDILLNSLNSDKGLNIFSEKNDFAIFGKVVLMQLLGLCRQ